MVQYMREEKYSKPKDLKEVLLLALKRENASVGFYNEMLSHNFPAEIKTLIEGLKNDELGHIAMIENKLKTLAR